jgi:hypothetical protein
MRGIDSGPSFHTLVLKSLSTFGALCALLAPRLAEARPGTHPIVVSTWDTRASSVALEYQHGIFDGGNFNTVSYHANFSATSGKLSSQFGLYYVNFSEAPPLPTTQGLAGSATAVFSLPVARRYDNGIPATAVDFYVGSAPTALVSGERNYITVPFVLGFGVPISPAKIISITPWLEFSPAVNLDTVIKPYNAVIDNPQDFYDPITGEVNITSEQIQQIMSQSVELEASGTVGARAGVDFALRASDAFDLKVNATLGSVGTAFSGTRVVYLGAGLVWRWDDIVPAILPPDKRLLHESCEDIETRFRSCPSSANWRTPEQLQKELGPPPLAPKAEPAQASPPAPAANPAPTSAPPPTPSSPDLVTPPHSAVPPTSGLPTTP